MVWTWLPVVVLGVSAGAKLADRGAQYVQASMMNVRAAAKRGAPIVKKLPIGTPVTMTPVKKGDWCRVGAGKEGEVGFAVCSLAGPGRPTLESVQRALDAYAKRAGEPSQDGNPAYRTKRYRDLIARRFFLSPSILTIFEYNAAAYYNTYGFPLSHGDFERLDLDAFAKALLAAYQGVIRGTDLRPLVRDWNRDRPVTTDMGAPGGIKPSFFRGPDDAYVLGGGLEIGRLRRRGRASRQEGPAGVSYSVANLGGVYALNVVEFLKLVPGAVPSVRHGPPTRSKYGPWSLGGVGSLEFTYRNQRPSIWIVTPEGITLGSLTMLKAILGDLPCMEVPQLATLTTGRPVDGRILVALIPTVPAPAKAPVFKRLGRLSWTLDLDADGVVDLAYLGESYTGDISGEPRRHGKYLINVAGQWQLALASGEPECT